MHAWPSPIVTSPVRPGRTLAGALGPALLLLLTSCSDPSSTTQHSPHLTLPSNVVARVGTDLITREDLLQAWLPQRHHRSPEDVLNDMIQFRVLLAEAKAARFHLRPDLQARFDQMLVQQYREEQLPGSTPSLPAPSPEAIAGYYQEHLADYTSPTLVRGAVLFLKCNPKATPDKQLECEQRAADLLNQARQTDDTAFRLLVQAHSEDQVSRYSGGDTGWLTLEPDHHRWDPALLQALFALRQPGEFAPLLQTRNGFYIVKLLARREAATQPLEEVREGIAHRLAQRQQQHNQEQYLQKILARSSVLIQRPVLQSLEDPALRAAIPPPALPPQHQPSL